MSATAGTSQPSSRADTPASFASSRASVATVEIITIVGDEGNGGVTVEPLVDRSFLEDKWRPDEYPCLATRGHKGNPLGAAAIDPSFGAEWTAQQRVLYSKALRVICANRIQRLATVADERQYLLAKLHIDKSAEKLRQLFAEVRWDAKLLQWLIMTLLDNLERQSLCIFMDLYRQIYQQVPALMEKCGLTNFNTTERFRHNNEVLQAITRPLYETQVPAQSEIAGSAGVGRPVFVLCPGDTPWSKLPLTQRLQVIGTCVSFDNQLAKARTRKSSQFASLCQLVLSELPKIRKRNPGQRIILLGHLIGARVAYEIARQEEVSAVVCLGFPLRLTPNGVVSKLADCELRNTPTLFVIGSSSLWSPLAEMDKVRRQTPGSTLTVIPGADDALQAEHRFVRMGTTQELCDQRAATEILSFLQTALNKPTGEVADKLEKKKRLVKRKLKDGEQKPIRAKKRKQAEAGKAQGTQKTGGHSAQSQESEIIKGEDTVTRYPSYALETPLPISDIQKVRLASAPGEGEGAKDEGLSCNMSTKDD